MNKPIERPPFSRIALPSKELCKQCKPGDDFEFVYFNAASTDITRTFNRVRAELASKPARALRAVVKR